MADSSTILATLGLIGGGTVLARPAILGSIASLFMPAWLVLAIRHLALPAVVAPTVLQPVMTGGEVDPTRLAMAAGVLLLGYLWRKMVFAFVTALAVLYFVPQLFAA